MSTQEKCKNSYWTDSRTESDDQVTTGEHLAVFTLISFAVLFLVIAGWNAVLLASGNVDSGGPLGYLMSYWPHQDTVIALQQSLADGYKAIDDLP